MKSSPFLQVLHRELKRMVSRRIYLVVCLVLPLFSLVFMTTIFGEGAMQDIPIGIVDEDNTSYSRSVVRNVEASPALHVIEHYVDETAAREAMRRTEIYAYVVIPSDFEMKMNDGKQVALRYYYQDAMLSVGGITRAVLERLLREEAMLPVVTEAMAKGMDTDEVAVMLMPTQAQDHLIYNPARNYSVYLSQPFFYVLLQVLLLLVTVYALGNEGKFGTSGEWLDVAGNDILTAVSGKLLPYTVVFCTMSVFANFVFFGLMHFPLPCGWLPMNLITMLFVLSTQALAVFLFALHPVLDMVVGITSMVGSLGATLSGITFPAPVMYTPVYVVSFLFPVRHLIDAFRSMLYAGGAFADGWESVAWLLFFLLLPLLMLPRLKRTFV